MVLGIRGIPNIQGGVETHAEQLYERLAALGCQVDALVRTPFVSKECKTHGAIKIRRLWSPKQPGLEAFVHSLLGVIYAGIVRPDILHIHAIGPALVTPLARVLGLRVVVTHHGPDYDRDKWGAFARRVLRAGERFGMRYSHARIAISQTIAELVERKHGLTSTVIPNGVVAPKPTKDKEHIERFGLESRRFVLQVSRMVPEKRQLELIEAFNRIRAPGWKLVLVGSLGDDNYSRRVRAAAASPGIVLTGFMKGRALEQVYAHARVFVLPSSHEGLPIALLEALSYGLPVLASNIPANLEVKLDKESYFPLGDIEALAARLRTVIDEEWDDALALARRQWVSEEYDWDAIAKQTLGLYQRCLGIEAPSRGSTY